MSRMMTTITFAFQYPGAWMLRSEREGKRRETQSSKEIETRLLHGVFSAQRTAHKGNFREGSLRTANLCN